MVRLWDLSGNIAEWVDWTIGSPLSTDITRPNRPYHSADIFPQNAWSEIDTLDTFTVFSPASAIMPFNITYNSSQGTGRYFGGNLALKSARRGGTYSSTVYAGVYGLSFNHSSTLADSSFGFRCVFRP